MKISIKATINLFEYFVELKIINKHALKWGSYKGNLTLPYKIKDRSIEYEYI